MKKITLMFLALIMSVGVMAQDAKKDKEEIKKLILTAYVDGLQNKGDLDATRQQLRLSRWLSAKWFKGSSFKGSKV